MSETFGQVIRKARREEEYSQRELAKLIGVDYTYLSKLENDHRKFGSETPSFYDGFTVKY